MSDTMDAIISKPITLDYLTPMSQLAQIAQQQQQTKLLQQQTQGAGIQNQLQGLSLARQNYLYGLAGIPGVGSPAAPSASGTGALPTPSAGPAGALPVGPSGNQGQSPGSAPAAAGQTSYPGQPGMEWLGVPVPPLLAASALTSADPVAATKALVETRRQALFSAVSVPPEQFPAAVAAAYRAGWITPEMAQQALADPTTQQKMQIGLATPEAHLSAVANLATHGQGFGPTTGQVGPDAGALAGLTAASGAEAGAKAQYEPPVEMKVPDGKGGFTVQQVPRVSIPYLSAGAAPVTGADMANPALSISGPAFAGRVAQSESGGNPAAGRSATSSASGGAQFLTSTWVPLARAAAPQQTQGMSDAQVAAMRNDTSPQGQALTQQVTQAYAQQNAAELAAKGLPVTSMTLGLAHQFGADGAAAVLGAPDSAKLAPLVGPDVIKANPQLANETVGDARTDAFRKYGVNPVSFAAAAAPGAAPTGGGPAPVVPGAIVGPPSLTAPQQAALEVQKAAQSAQNANDIAAMGTHRTELATTATSAVQNNALLDQMRVNGQGFDHGSFTDTYQSMKKVWGSLAQSMGGTMPASVGSWEDFQKNAGQLARTTASALSPRVGVQELQLVQKYLPSATMSPQAFSRIADQTQGLNDYQIAKNAAAADFMGRPAQFEAQFNQNVTPGVFIVHRMSAPDAMTFKAALSATPEGRETWSRIMSGAKYANDHGLFDAIGG